MLDVSDGSVDVADYDSVHDVLLDHTLTQLDLLSTVYFCYNRTHDLCRSVQQYLALLVVNY